MEKDETQHPHVHLITVFLNGSQEENKKEIPGGEYVVSKLKEVLGVPADRVLEIVKEEGFVTLKDDESIHVHEGEKFASHVRKGGSS